MSTKVFLVKYGVFEEEKLTEENLEIIETAFITNELLSDFHDFLVNRNVYELAEDGKEADNFQIEIFSDDSIQKICLKLEVEFINMFKNKSNVFKDDDLLSIEDLDDAIFEFRTITNLLYLFRLKDKKFKKDKSVIVKIG